MSSGPCSFYKELDPGLAFSGRPALGLQPSLNLSERHCDLNRNRLLFSDPAGNRVEFPLGLPIEFLVIVSGTASASELPGGNEKSGAPEARDIPALHRGNYPCPRACILWAGSPQGVSPPFLSLIKGERVAT